MLAPLLTRPARRFSPDRLPNLGLWVKADAITGLNDGDAVATWPDSSTNANNLTEATNKPTYKTNILNGLPVVRFNGTSHRLTGTAISATAMTIIAVLNRQADSGSYRAAIVTDKINLYSRLGGGAPALTHWGAFQGQNIDSTVLIGSSFVVAALVVRAQNDIDLATNGASVTKTNGSGYNAKATLQVGGSSADGQWHDGDIAEVLIYTRALVSGERKFCERYLARKWGLTIQ